MDGGGRPAGGSRERCPSAGSPVEPSEGRVAENRAHGGRATGPRGTQQGEVCQKGENAGQAPRQMETTGHHADPDVPRKHGGPSAHGARLRRVPEARAKGAAGVRVRLRFRAPEARRLARPPGRAEGAEPLPREGRAGEVVRPAQSDLEGRSGGRECGRLQGP